MNTIDDLRSALDDGATPAGIDLNAVRRRAEQQRRWTAAGAAAAVVAVALAVALPLATTGGAAPTHGATRTQSAGPPSTDDCPNSFPADLGNSGPGLDEQLVPMAVDSVLACEYHGAYVNRQPPPPAASQRLVASRSLPATSARTLLATFQAGATRHPYCRGAERSSILLLVTGAGRTVRLRVDPFACGLITNGHAVRFPGPPATAILPALLAATPARLSCPAQPESQPWPDRNARPGGHLISFVPDRLVFCRYGPMPGTSLDQGSPQEVDGAGAAEVIRRLDGQPDFQYVPCPIPAGDHYQYEVVLTGQGQRATLGGNDAGCSILASASRVVTGVDWGIVLDPTGLPR
ncbi:MAG TPA: hypothetical protein VMU51_01995 [Mycobacteriales bacterium]|nr:hypothetical protein [Mycobacteriales bacterium]